MAIIAAGNLSARFCTPSLPRFFCSWEGVDADASLSDRIHQSYIEFPNTSWVFAVEIQEVCPRSLE